MPLKALVGAAVVLASLATGTSTGPRKEVRKETQKHGGDGVVYAARTDPLAKPSTTCDRVAAPWGSKRGNGSWSHPVRGPYRLVKLLKTGETGCFRNGIYHEPETRVNRERITLQSAPGEHAIWRGRVVLRGRGDRLIGLTLDGSYGPSCCGGGGTLPSPTIHAADVVVAGNDISSPDSGICVHPRSWGHQRPDNFRILGNRVHDCGRRPHTEHDHGIYVADGYNGQIRDNVVYDNADRGIQLYPEAKYTLVDHNTVDGNGTGIVFSERSAANRVQNNVFTNSVVRWNAETFRLTGRGNRFAGNCVRPGNSDPEYNENGGVALPPTVTQKGNRRARDSVYGATRTAGDLRVQPTSACAGKGAPDSVARPAP
jgi:parallel beta-helix repeat protein